MPLLRHDNQKRALVPFWMLDADDGGLTDLGVTGGEVLELDRRDPFPAGLDDILGPVSDLHVAVPINSRNVSGIKEILLINDVAGVPEVSPGNGRPTHLQPAEGLPITRPFHACIIDDFHLDAEWRMALLHLNIQALFSGQDCIFGFQRSERAEGAHFGHSPGVAHFHAIAVLEYAQHFAWARGATNDHLL